MNKIKKIFALSKILYNYKKKKETLSSMPIRLWIESSFSCNLKCVMCPNKDIPAAKKGMMDIDLFKKIIDEAKGFVSDVYLHHRGEPFLNPNIYQMIAYAKKNDITVRMHTNATVLNKEKIEKVLDCPPDMISVSFDGFQKDIYEEIREGGDFDKTVDNIFTLLNMRKERNLTKPYLIVEKIDFNKYKEKTDHVAAKALADKFKQHGLDEFIEKEEYTWVTESAPDINDKAYSQCTFPWYAMVICADGTVTPCPQDYMAGMPLGNLKENTISEVWNGEKYKELRYNLLHNLEKQPLCQKCDRLTRKQVAGIPFQYLYTFLADNFLGYGRLKKLIGSFERS